MTQDAGPVKAVFFCPLVGNIDEGDGDMFMVGDSYLADSADEISDALNRYTADDENDMAAYYNKDDGVSEKLTSAVWSVELHGDRLFGRIDCSLKEHHRLQLSCVRRERLNGYQPPLKGLYAVQYPVLYEQRTAWQRQHGSIGGRAVFVSFQYDHNRIFAQLHESCAQKGLLGHSGKSEHRGFFDSVNP